MGILNSLMEIFMGPKVSYSSVKINNAVNNNGSNNIVICDTENGCGDLYVDYSYYVEMYKSAQSLTDEMINCARFKEMDILSIGVPLEKSVTDFKAMEITKGSCIIGVMKISSLNYLTITIENLGEEYNVRGMIRILDIIRINTASFSNYAKAKYAFECIRRVFSGDTEVAVAIHSPYGVEQFITTF